MIQIIYNFYIFNRFLIFIIIFSYTIEFEIRIKLQMFNTNLLPKEWERKELEEVGNELDRRRRLNLWDYRGVT